MSSLLKIFFVSICTIVYTNINAYTATVEYSKSDSTEIPNTYLITTNTDSKIYTAAEQMPRFPQGSSALSSYINNSIKYPLSAIEDGIQGHVIIQFVVTDTGKIREVKIARGLSTDIDNEAIRVIKSLPDFIPGRIRGKKVNVWYTLPISFYPPKATPLTY